MNPHIHRTLTPEASASTNSATLAYSNCPAVLDEAVICFPGVRYLAVTWCEGGDLNPHIHRTLTPEASASTNSATLAYSNCPAVLDEAVICFPGVRYLAVTWCEGGDLNPHIHRTLTPEASASTNSATLALPRTANSIDFLPLVNTKFSRKVKKTGANGRLVKKGANCSINVSVWLDKS